MEGRTALVTGASSGIGKACAEQLAMRGVHLIICSRSKTRLEVLAEQWRENYKVNVSVIAKDLSQYEEVMDLLMETEEMEIHMLLHAAGFGTSGSFLDNSFQNEMDMVHLNISSTTILTYEFGQRFKNQKGGDIILISSLLAFQGVPFASNYAASKAYVQTFAEGLMTEFKTRGVNVLVAAPGPVETKFADRAGMTMSNTATPEEVAVEIVKNIGSSKTLRPGKLTKFLSLSLAPLTRSLKIRVMESLMSKMTNNA